MQYTVSVNGEEPNEALVSPPDTAVLDRNLNSAKTSTCGCKPRAEGHVTLVGRTPDTEHVMIQGAVKDAVDKENKGKQCILYTTLTFLICPQFLLYFTLVHLSFDYCF